MATAETTLNCWLPLLEGSFLNFHDNAALYTLVISSHSRPVTWSRLNRDCNLWLLKILLQSGCW